MSEHAESLSATNGMVPLATSVTLPLDAGDPPALSPHEPLPLDEPTTEIRHLLEENEEPTLEDRARIARTFAGSRDGRRSLIHACLVRDLLTPTAPSARWLQGGLAMLEILQERPVFAAGSLVSLPGEAPADTEVSAAWEVVHTTLSTLQEVGWYYGIETVMYPTSTLGDQATGEDFDRFFAALSAARETFGDALLAWDVEKRLRGWGNLHKARPGFHGLSDVRSPIGGPAQLRKVVR